jgi:hypothetical protein
MTVPLFKQSVMKEVKEDKEDKEVKEGKEIGAA